MRITLAIKNRTGRPHGSKVLPRNPRRQGSLLAALPFPAQGQCVPTLPPQPGAEPPYFSLSRRLALSSLLVPGPQLSTPSQLLPPPSPGLARTLLDRRLPSTYHTYHHTYRPSPPLPLSPAPSNPPASAIEPCPPIRIRSRRATPSAEAKRAASGSPPPRPPPSALRRWCWIGVEIHPDLFLLPLISARLISGHIEYKAFSYGFC